MKNDLKRSTNCLAENNFQNTRRVAKIASSASSSVFVSSFDCQNKVRRNYNNCKFTESSLALIAGTFNHIKPPLKTKQYQTQLTPNRESSDLTLKLVKFSNSIIYIYIYIYIIYIKYNTKNKTLKNFGKVCFHAKFCHVGI